MVVWAKDAHRFSPGDHFGSIDMDLCPVANMAVGADYEQDVKQSSYSGRCESCATTCFASISIRPHPGSIKVAQRGN